MERAELKPIIEAMVFVAEEPITERMLLAALEETQVTKEELRAALAEIEAEWNEAPERGLQLAAVAGGYQFRTKEAMASWLRKLNVPKPMRLSGPALETLAIVAYKQPIVRSEIETIRGVDSGGVLKTLLERRLLRIVGRRDEPGQPLLYGTTKEFLEIFNLRNLKELPTLRDIEELAREHRAKGSAPKEGEELTELLPKEGIEEEDEEETEVIERRPIDDDEESEKDHEALSHLETTLKDLRRLERSVFPKEERTPQPGEAHADQSGAEAAPTAEADTTPTDDAGAPAQDAPAADAPGADDRPFE